MRRSYLALPATAVAAAALTPLAMATSRPAHAAKATVAVAAKEFKFTLRPTSAKNGVVTFQVKNNGTIDHDFKIAGKMTPKIHRGKSAALTVTLKKGMYPYLCTIPGHAASGMKGTFRVT